MGEKRRAIRDSERRNRAKAIQLAAGRAISFDALLPAPDLLSLTSDLRLRSGRGAR